MVQFVELLSVKKTDEEQEPNPNTDPPLAAQPGGMLRPRKTEEVEQPAGPDGDDLPF